jgi:uncharacterized membrane protein YczE
MLSGVIFGTYSSIGIAAPLLRNRRMLHTIVYILIAGAIIGIAATMVDSKTFVAVVAGLMVVCLAFAIQVERKLDLPATAAI